MVAIAESHHAQAALRGLMSRARAALARHGAHPARTVVLMPFAHLLQPAREAWAREVPDGFAPRLETTRTWSAAAGFEPAADDFCGDVARDLLTARSLLERAGLAAQGELLAPRLVEAAGQLAPVACAVEPGARRAWAARARHGVAPAFDAPMLAHEGAIAGIAIEWVAASAFATDRLLDAAVAREIDLLLVVPGLREDPLATAIAQRLGERAEVLPLDAQAPLGRIAMHEAEDPADEASRAAACVLAHIQGGRVPVALAAVDRVLTRRIRALLEEGGAAIRDETGWKLSTTRAAAHVMLVLRACTHAAGADAVIDWLKNSPVHAPGAVLAIERRVRREGLRDWRSVRPADVGDGQQALLAQVNAWRAAMQDARALPQWLAHWRELLRASGQWPALERDAAGAQVLAALRLGEIDRAELEGLPAARRRMTLAEFMAWASDTLEAGTFRPPAAERAEVVILPFHQLLGRPFAALVIPGCDEARLPASPDPAGTWSAAQREWLGLPSRQALEAEARSAWRQALQAPHCDVLWRRTDASGEPVVPSPLVQELLLAAIAAPGADGREARRIEAAPVQPPAAIAAVLGVEQLSASAYEDLRKCPYRFFALRQLGLQEPDEIDVDLGKRDFGNWLHRVLSTFHARLAEQGVDDARARARLLDEAAQAAMREMRLDEGEFLPFRAAWNQAREGYLEWLARHEAKEGAVFLEAEGEHERTVGATRLIGRIDRIDRLRDGRRMVMDYKTEGLLATQERVKRPGEDTQLAFYAALLGDDALRAAYVNVGERGETKTVEQEDVALAREMLLAGIAHDFGRIAAGAPLPALGEGVVCEYCAARGLCRKDSWS